MSAALSGTASSPTRCCGITPAAWSATRPRCTTSSIAGRFFKVRGPLNTPPSPQGRPVLLQAGGSPRGIRAAAYVADMAFGADMPLDLQIAQRKALDGQWWRSAATRRRGHRVAAALVVAETEREAHRAARSAADRDPAGRRRRLSVAQRRATISPRCRSGSRSVSCMPRSSPAMPRRSASCAS